MTSVCISVIKCNIIPRRRASCDLLGDDVVQGPQRRPTERSDRCIRLLKSVNARILQSMLLREENVEGEEGEGEQARLEGHARINIGAESWGVDNNIALLHLHSFHAIPFHLYLRPRSMVLRRRRLRHSSGRCSEIDRGPVVRRLPAVGATRALSSCD
jgi:hypothetical protein